MLGEHPELAAKIRAEADARLVAGKAPTLDQVRSLDLARSASREVLRSYPIAPVTFFGVAKKDLEFDLSCPQQDATPGGGGLGPLPKSGVGVQITKRAS